MCVERMHGIFMNARMSLTASSDVFRGGITMSRDIAQISRAWVSNVSTLTFSDHDKLHNMHTLQLRVCDMIAHSRRHGHARDF